jgi:hypothetical protein
MDQNRSDDASTRTIWPFWPENVCDPSPGCYLQLPRERDTPWELSREDDLFYLKATLISQIGARLSGEKSATAIGRYVARPGVSFETAKRRWRHLKRCVETRTASERSNSVIEACKRDIAGRNKFVDHLLNDQELVWQLIKLKDISIAQLALKCSEQDCVVALTASQDQHEKILGYIKDAYFNDRSGMKGWWLIRMLFTYLCKAQSEGDIVEYAHRYVRMILVLKSVFALRRISPAADWSVNELMFSDVSWEFGRFLQDWYSRIYVINTSFEDICGAARLLHTRGVRATWQIIEPDRPARQICGLYIEPDEQPSDRLILKIKGDCPSNFLDAHRHVKRHPEMLRGTWPKLVTNSICGEVTADAPIVFDGYIRRRRDPRRQVLSICRVNLRRHLLRQSRRGAWSALEETRGC